MGRWSTLERFLERPAHPSMHQGFEASSDSFDNLETVRSLKVLCVGAGGLGCELLKDLAYMGFQNIHVIDMDTIDVSNLNRQFLFRLKDVGQSKADTAARFINGRVPGCTVVPHFGKIEDKDEDFYRSFNLVICGLDSVQARRWINAMVCSLLEFDDDGVLDPSTIIPIIDGGTEGFKGNMRLIIPGMTACVECTLDLYPPQVNFPMCTIAHTPRLPEHCIEYVRVLLWPKDTPFRDAEIDGDDPDHIQWIYEKSLERAKEFKINGVTHRLTQGVVKRIIPAVASTNACIAALCAQEAFKLATDCSLRLSNYLNFQDTDGISTNVVCLEKRDDCPVCSRKPQNLTVDRNFKLADLIKHLQDSPEFQLRSPGIYFGSLPLYVPSVPSLEQHTRPNLKRSLVDLGVEPGTTLIVADVTRPNPIELTLAYSAVSSSTGDTDSNEVSDAAANGDRHMETS